MTDLMMILLIESGNAILPFDKGEDTGNKTSHEELVVEYLRSLAEAFLGF